MYFDALGSLHCLLPCLSSWNGSVCLVVSTFLPFITRRSVMDRGRLAHYFGRCVACTQSQWAWYKHRHRSTRTMSSIELSHITPLFGVFLATNYKIWWDLVVIYAFHKNIWHSKAQQSLRDTDLSICRRHTKGQGYGWCFLTFVTFQRQHLEFSKLTPTYVNLFLLH